MFPRSATTALKIADLEVRFAILADVAPARADSGHVEA